MCCQCRSLWRACFLTGRNRCWDHEQTLIRFIHESVCGFTIGLRPPASPSAGLLPAPSSHFHPARCATRLMPISRAKFGLENLMPCRSVDEGRSANWCATHLYRLCSGRRSTGEARVWANSRAKAGSVNSLGSTPGEVMIAQGQVPITLSGDLEDGIGNAGLDRGAAVVRHAIQPMPGLEEGDVDLGRVLLDA
jgi:hypothetical protein